MTQNQIDSGIADCCTPELLKTNGNNDFQTFLGAHLIRPNARYSPEALQVHFAFLGNTKTAEWIIQVVRHFKPKNQTLPNVVLGESPVYMRSAKTYSIRISVTNC